MKNVKTKDYSFALRVKVAREQQDRDLIKNIVCGALIIGAIGAMLYFAPDAIHGSLAFKEAVVNTYR